MTKQKLIQIMRKQSAWRLAKADQFDDIRSLNSSRSIEQAIPTIESLPDNHRLFELLEQVEKFDNGDWFAVLRQAVASHGHTEQRTVTPADFVSRLIAVTSRFIAEGN